MTETGLQRDSYPIDAQPAANLMSKDSLDDIADDIGIVTMEQIETERTTETVDEVAKPRGMDEYDGGWSVDH